MLIVIRNRHDKLSLYHGQNCISYSANTFGKGMNSTILPLTMGKK